MPSSYRRCIGMIPGLATATVLAATSQASPAQVYAQVTEWGTQGADCAAPPANEAKPWLDPVYSPECRARYALAAFHTLDEKLLWISPPPDPMAPPSGGRPTRPEEGCAYAPKVVPVYREPPTLARRPAAPPRPMPSFPPRPAKEKSKVRDMREVLALPAVGQSSDGPAGIRGADCVTAFNTPLSVAATFDPSMAARYGDLMGRDFHDAGYNFQWGPAMDVARTWRFGRVTESYGEDPYLIAQTAGPVIHAVGANHVVSMMKHFAVYAEEQGRVGDQPSGQQPAVNNALSERAIREIYLPGFKAAVHVGGAGQAMCSFPRVNGIYACENSHLFDILKREWGFDGNVGPDFPSAQRSIVPAVMAGLDNGTMSADDGTFAGQMSLREGVESGLVPEKRLDDIILRRLIPQFRLGVFEHPAKRNAPDVSTPERRKALVDVVTAGSVLLKNEDGILPFGPAVKSVAIIGAQATEKAQVVEQGSALVNVQHLEPVLTAVERRAGRRVSVRFEQGTYGLEPLSAVPPEYFAIDGHAGVKAEYFTNPDFDFSGEPAATTTQSTLDVAGEPRGFKLPAHQQWTARYTTRFTPRKSGVQKFSIQAGGSLRLFVDGKPAGTIERADFGDALFTNVDAKAGQPIELRIEYTPRAALAPTPMDMFGAVGGTQIKFGYAPPDTMIADAAAAAAKADVAVVFAGAKVGEGMDRTTLALSNDQDALIEAVAAANPRTVVVLNTGGAVAMPWLDKVAGVLEMWLPGDVDGAAAAALLFGDAEPGGRLPVTFPASEDQGPATKPFEYPGTLDAKGRLDTAWFDEGVFVGYRYWDKHGQQPLFPFGYGLGYTTFAVGDYSVAAEAKGGATVKLTLRNTGKREGAETIEVYLGFPRSAGEPPRQLKAFRKVRLAPGESRRVEIPIAADAFLYWDEGRDGWRRAAGAYTVQVGRSSRDIDWQGTL